MSPLMCFSPLKIPHFNSTFQLGHHMHLRKLKIFLMNLDGNKICIARRSTQQKTEKYYHHLLHYPPVPFFQTSTPCTIWHLLCSGVAEADRNWACNMHERDLKITIDYYDPVMKRLNDKNGKILRIKAAILLQTVDEIGNFSEISDFGKCLKKWNEFQSNHTFWNFFSLFFGGGGYNRRLKFLRGGVPVIKSSLVNFSFFPPQGIRVIFNTKLICFHYPWIVHSIIWYKIMLTNPTCLVDLEKIKFECTSKSHNEYNVSLLHIFTPQNCIWNTIIFFWKEVIQKLCWPDFGIFRAPTYPWLTLLKTFSYFYVYEVLFMCQWHFSYHLPTSSWQRSFWRTTNEINHFFSVFKVQILDK